MQQPGSDQPANVFDQFDATPKPQAASEPRFPGVPVDAANDPWAAFPDAKAPANVFDQFDKLPPGFRVVEFEGQRVQVPNDFTDDEISSALSTLTSKPLAPGKGPRVQSPAGDGPWMKYGAPASRQAVTQVKAPDGSIVEFPAGTPNDVMTKAMQETFGGPSAPTQPPVADPWAQFPDAPAQATLPELEDALRNADAAGDAAAARQLADEIVRQRSAASAPASPLGNVIRHNLGLPEQPVEQPPISTAKDVGESFASGVPRGVVETAMFPITLSRMVEGAGNYLYNKVENGVRYAIGADPLSEEELARREAGINASPAYGVQDRTREIMDAVLHKPQTTAGKYAGTIGEFAAPGGLPSKGARMAETGLDVARRYGADLLGNVVAPAVASEAAGQATEGTPYEGMMRFLGALFGNAGTAAVRAHNAPESVVRRATGDLTDVQWQRARDLQNNSVGVHLTGPEAISQATSGATALPTVQRVVEGSTNGGARMGPFFAQRVGQVGSAVGNVLDQVAPQSAQPSTLGPRAAEAAAEIIDRTRQGINTQTRPLYQAAEAQSVPADQFGAIAADPRFVAGVERLRANPELSPEYMTSPVGAAGPVPPQPLPANSIPVIDAVTKDLNARGEALANPANPLYGPELAGRSRTAAADARNAATRASPEYAQALAEQEALRRTQLNPLEQGPVGRVAAATNTAGAGNALLPHDPLTGSAGEAADATRRLAAQDPETTAALVRQNLADRFTKASTETQEGIRDYAGAKFRKDVAGNDTRRDVLDAVLRSLPGGEASADRMGELLDVLQATGRRKPIGSATEFNRALNADLGDASPAARAIAVPTSLGRSLFTSAGDAVRRRAMRDGVSTLADMFIAPNSVDLIRNARNRTGRAMAADAAARTALESGTTLYGQ
ncbi:MAG: hypothetical protein EOQ44_26810 [Mesorhizobium sp.]|nr:MAG: hypothetical protein EOQ44_26810 [Mesorhizobium sp.]